ncbi:MAG: PAS domain-containing protein [Nitrospira sp.]|nr:PAS domain-containing protein [bacterium]MBL7048405.1 PAS domain-containing protein [Nitrospira sp.]
MNKDNKELLTEIERLIKRNAKPVSASGEWTVAMNSVKECIVLADSKGKIKEYNGAFARLVGKSEDQLIGADWEQLLYDSDMEADTFFAGSVEMLHKPTSKCYEIVTHPYKSEGTDEEGIVVMLHDTTQVRSIGKALEVRNVEIGEHRREFEQALDKVSELIRSVIENRKSGARFDNPHLKACYEVKDCKKTDCVCHGKGAMRCWQMAGTFCGGEVQGAFAQKYGNCSKCNVFQDAIAGPIFEIGEQFNNMMHILELRNKELKAINAKQCKADGDDKA